MRVAVLTVAWVMAMPLVALAESTTERGADMGLDSAPAVYASPFVHPVSAVSGSAWQPPGSSWTASTAGDSDEPSPTLLAKRDKQVKTEEPRPVRPPITLSAERVQVLLRSLTVPGWGQASVGRRTSATVFALTELGVWSSFTAFRVQEQLRRTSYERTARILAGIDLDGRDEEFRRIVGAYLSSEEYNLLVVSRDAANLYYDDPVRYREYIAQNSLRGGDAWAWPDDEGLLRYRSQRKDAQRARLRANTSLALAVVNRLVSVLHAARARGHTIPPKHSWDLDTIPQDGDPTAVRLGIRTRF